MYLPFIIIPIMFVIVFVIVIISIAGKAKTFKNLQNRAKDIFNNLQENLLDESIIIKNKPDVECEYCGAVLSADTKKCPNCSAAVKKK